MRKKKYRMTFGLKLVMLIALMSAAFIGAVVIINYRLLFNWNLESFVDRGNALTAMITGEVSARELDKYFDLIDLESPEESRARFEPDLRYMEIEQFLIDLDKDEKIGDLYIGRAVDGLGIVIIFDSVLDGESAFDTGDLPLGTTYMSEAVSGKFEELLEGRKPEKMVDREDKVVTLAEPFYLGDGAPSGYYALVDIPIVEIVDTQNRYMNALFIVLGPLAAIFLGIYLLVIRQSFVKPLRGITRAVQSCAEGAGAEAFEALKLKGSAELQTLSDNFYSMLLELREHHKKRRALAVREQRMQSELRLANDLSMAVLPRELPEREAEYPFEIHGGITRGGELTCCFYDYFLLPGDRLCVMIGETPGGGMARALFTVMAQAAIKSRLMSELSLGETMTSANRQLFEMGRDMYLNVLVGILDGITGSFTCVNAGQRPPLLMRGRERYDWVEAYPHAPLGQNENVAYRELELKLGQGDRIFFHTEGLGEIPGRDGERFGDRRLRMALNEKESREAELQPTLSLVDRAAADFSDGRGRAEGYAMMALEYCRRDRAQAHCILTADGNGEKKLASFLREQLKANDITGRQAAQTMVLGDELFTLCRGRMDTDGRLLAECSIRDGLAVLRFRGGLGGEDPLTTQTEGPARNAAEYIVRNCEHVSFEHGESSDTVIVVKRVDDGEAGTASREQ